ncbi:MAG: hypothetical protein R3F36_00970 [Candidatus Competibacteraceae bacterium]
MQRVLEMLGVSLSKKARARAIQLPAWNEALGLPRPWDQQWALRMQQVLAFETDLLDMATFSTVRPSSPPRSRRWSMAQQRKWLGFRSRRDGAGHRIRLRQRQLVTSHLSGCAPSSVGI